MLKDETLEPRLKTIRDKIWGKYLKGISEETGISLGLLKLVERNQRKRLSDEQYTTLEQYIIKQGW
tara:strand:- start:92 stop:289 length:198 start_codon:yes stop_codon:yes gene_type:complete